MPTAESFTSLGAGNGLNVCTRRLDVSTFDHWTTFSGVTNSSPGASEEKIGESIALAAKYFWNTASFDVSGIGHNLDTQSSQIFNEEVTLNKFKLDFQDFTYEDQGPFEPRLRCLAGTAFPRYNPDDPDPDAGRYYYEVQNEVYDFSVGGPIFNPSPMVVRMYNGDTTDEGNFVGYGAAEKYASNQWSSIVPEFINQILAGGRYIQGKAKQNVFATLNICGALNDQEDSEGIVFKEQIVEIDDIYFVIGANVSWDPGTVDEEFTYEEDGEEYTVTRTSTVEKEITYSTGDSIKITSTRNSVLTDTGPAYDPYNDTVVATAKVKFDSLSFYTY